MTPGPMQSLRLAADLAGPGAAPADTQVILLPGAYNRAQDFVAAGFGEIARAAGCHIELVLPEVDLPQLSSGELPALLYEHFVLPARAAGVKNIWLGGASLGGFNSLCYADTYQGTPGAIDGLCLLAPWPGSRIARNAIEAAGGLARWQPTSAELAADAELRVWHWLRQRANATQKLPVFLGWGSEDRFAAGIGAYAEVLPEARVRTVPGGHDWDVWSTLWEIFCTGFRSG